MPFYRVENTMIDYYWVEAVDPEEAQSIADEAENRDAQVWMNSEIIEIAAEEFQKVRGTFDA